LVDAMNHNGASDREHHDYNHGNTPENTLGFWFARFLTHVGIQSSRAA